MKNLFILIFLLSGCTTLPQLYQAAEDIADDDAIKVSISKEAIEKQNIINVTVDINKNPTNK